MKGEHTKHTNRASLFCVAVTYVFIVTVITLHACFSDPEPFDLGLTVSLYIGHHLWSILLYFVGAVIIGTLLALFVRNTAANPAQKILYYAILACILGCAWFPCNSGRSRLCTDIHDCISYLLAVLVAVSFIMMGIFARSKRQRIYAACCMAYAAFFVAAFALDLRPFHDTIFIWENLLIVLFFFEVCLEGAPAKASAQQG